MGACAGAGGAIWATLGIGAACSIDIGSYVSEMEVAAVACLAYNVAKMSLLTLALGVACFSVFRSASFVDAVFMLLGMGSCLFLIRSGVSRLSTSLLISISYGSLTFEPLTQLVLCCLFSKN